MAGDQLAFDEVLDLCRDKHRRIVLATFGEQQRTLTMNDLVKTIAKHNHYESLREISEETLTRIQTAGLVETIIL